jgi:hypothetical protein
LTGVIPKRPGAEEGGHDPSPSEQGADLVGHGIVRVQHRPGRQTDWLVLSPVQAQFDLRAFRSGPDIKACEGCTPQVGFDLESFAQVRRDDDVHCLPAGSTESPMPGCAVRGAGHINCVTVKL